MPSASRLIPRGIAPSSYSGTAVEDGLELDLQAPSSSLRQHLDPEALPQPDYFESLDELHLWYQMRHAEVLNDHSEPCKIHTGPPTHPATTASNGRKPKLVVCHDFQGGYNEDPHQQGYSLEHLHLVDTFIYFSHKRVSIPPVGWLHACRRTGTKVLGTLIFEWAESAPDLARLLRGPERKAMPLRGAVSLSQQYAVELIQLALERGFSGYLVNIEVALDLGFGCSGEPWPAWVGQEARVGEMHKNAERLRAWVHFLREEGTRRFVQAGKRADEWEVMWYDSVVYPHGQLAWQDALNEYNIDFFQSAHTFFTNYTWARPPQPLPPGQLIDPSDDSPQTLQLRGFKLTGPEDGGYHPQLLLSAAMADSVARARTDVHVGIDVFGRNCWGGLKAWRSLDMIGTHRWQDLEALQLSVALFAPGWTWEEENAGQTLPSEQASMKRKWSDWWHIDLAFWIGVPRPLKPVTHRITLAEHDVRPVQLYFGGTSLERDRLERRASAHGFYTDFGFGSGTRCFDRGELVHEWPAGFTDMGVCMPKPDLLFAAWHEHRHDEARQGFTWAFDHDRAWSGTTSLVVAMTPPSGTQTGAVTVSLCSAVVTCSGCAGEWTAWRYTIIVDGQQASADRISPIVSTLDSGSAEIVEDSIERTQLEHGWCAISIPVRIRADDNAPIALSLGLSLQSPTTQSVRLGAVQLSRFQSEEQVGELQVHRATGVCESAGTLPPATLVWPSRQDGESQPCNVWIQATGQPATRCWLGTSTREATCCEFCLPHPMALPPHLTNTTLEFTVTALGVDHTTVARGPATVSP